MTLAFLAALGGMVLYGLASVSQGYAAARASGPAVLRHPGYLAGLAGDGLAWLCSLLALTRLPLFAVQSLLAGSLAVTVLVAVPVLKVRMGRRDVAAVAVVTVGLVLVSASASAESTRPAPGWFDPALAVGLVLLGLVSALAYRRGRSVPLAVLAALGFSGAAIGARVARLGEGSLAATLADPMTWLVVAYGLIGAVMYARSLERGPIGPATAALWVVEVVVPGLLGVAVLGDTVRPGWDLPALLGVALAVGACVVLAHSPAQAG